MKINSVLSGNDYNQLFDRQEEDCPDVIEKAAIKIPKRYRDDIIRLRETYNLHEGLTINISLLELKRMCERDYNKVEAYRGLKNFLLYALGITLNIYSQKTKRMQENVSNNIKIENR